MPKDIPALPPLLVDGCPKVLHRMTSTDLRTMLFLALKSVFQVPSYVSCFRFYDYDRPEWWASELPWSADFLRVLPKGQNRNQYLRHLITSCYHYYKQEFTLYLFDVQEGEPLRWNLLDRGDGTWDLLSAHNNKVIWHFYNIYQVMPIMALQATHESQRRSSGSGRVDRHGTGGPPFDRPFHNTRLSRYNAAPVTSVRLPRTAKHHPRDEHAGPPKPSIITTTRRSENCSWDKCDTEFQDVRLSLEKPFHCDRCGEDIVNGDGLSDESMALNHMLTCQRARTRKQQEKEHFLLHLGLVRRETATQLQQARQDVKRIPVCSPNLASIAQRIPAMSPLGQIIFRPDLIAAKVTTEISDEKASTTAAEVTAPETEKEESESSVMRSFYPIVYRPLRLITHYHELSLTKRDRVEKLQRWRRGGLDKPSWLMKRLCVPLQISVPRIDDQIPGKEPEAKIASPIAPSKATSHRRLQGASGSKAADKTPLRRLEVALKRLEYCTAELHRGAKPVHIGPAPLTVKLSQVVSVLHRLTTHQKQALMGVAAKPGVKSSARKQRLERRRLRSSAAGQRMITRQHAKLTPDVAKAPKVKPQIAVSSGNAGKRKQTAAVPATTAVKKFREAEKQPDTGSTEQPKPSVAHTTITSTGTSPIPVTTSAYTEVVKIESSSSSDSDNSSSSEDDESSDDSSSATPVAAANPSRVATRSSGVITAVRPILPAPKGTLSPSSPASSLRSRPRKQELRSSARLGNSGLTSGSSSLSNSPTKLVSTTTSSSAAFQASGAPSILRRLLPHERPDDTIIVEGNVGRPMVRQVLSSTTPVAFGGHIAYVPSYSYVCTTASSMPNHVPPTNSNLAVSVGGSRFEDSKFGVLPPGQLPHRQTVNVNGGYRPVYSASTASNQVSSDSLVGPMVPLGAVRVPFPEKETVTSVRSTGQDNVPPLTFFKTYTPIIERPQPSIRSIVNQVRTQQQVQSRDPDSAMHLPVFNGAGWFVHTLRTVPDEMRRPMPRLMKSSTIRAMTSAANGNSVQMPTTFRQLPPPPPLFRPVVQPPPVKPAAPVVVSRSSSGPGIATSPPPRKGSRRKWPASPPPPKETAKEDRASSKTAKLLGEGVRRAQYLSDTGQVLAGPDAAACIDQILSSDAVPIDLAYYGKAGPASSAIWRRYQSAHDIEATTLSPKLSDDGNDNLEGVEAVEFMDDDSNIADRVEEVEFVDNDSIADRVEEVECGLWNLDVERETLFSADSNDSDSRGANSSSQLMLRPGAGPRVQEVSRIEDFPAPDSEVTMFDCHMCDCHQVLRDSVWASVREHTRTFHSSTRPVFVKQVKRAYVDGGSFGRDSDRAEVPMTLIQAYADVETARKHYQPDALIADMRTSDV